MAFQASEYVLGGGAQARRRQLSGSAGAGVSGGGSHPAAPLDPRLDRGPAHRPAQVPRCPWTASRVQLDTAGAHPRVTGRHAEPRLHRLLPLLQPQEPGEPEEPGESEEPGEGTGEQDRGQGVSGDR